MNKVWHARRALSRVVESGPALPAGADLPAGLPARDRPICAFTAAGNDRFTAVGQWMSRAKDL
jgi:hypothetical protein